MTAKPPLVAARHSRTPLSPSILFQLAFHHMLALIQVKREMKALLSQLTQRLSPKKQAALQDQIQDLLQQLIAPFDDRLVDHPWSPPQGVLSKLRRDALRFSVELGESEETFAWWETVEETWRAAMVASQTFLPAPLVKLIKLSERAALQLLSLSVFFRKDENVLYCLLTHHADIDSWLRAGYTLDMLRRFHIRGLTGLESFIAKGYRRRGFPEHLPQISLAMAEMMGDVTCCT